MQEAATLEVNETAPAITYRLLPPEEWGKVQHVFEESGMRMPVPEASFIAVAEKEGEVIGFLTVQPMFHATPLWLKGGEGSGVARSLLEKAEDFMRTVGATGAHLYLFSDSPLAGQIAKAIGFSHAPWHVWQKEVK